MWSRRNRREGRGDSFNGEGGLGGAPRRREGRGWGPFTGGQLTAIIIMLVVMVMLPVGAFAVVSGTNSFITDATSGVRAKVDAKGNLNTATHDAVTGTAAKVNSSGQQLAAVTGSVIVNGVARPSNPTGLYTTFQWLNSPEPSPCITFAPPAGMALVITSVIVNDEGPQLFAVSHVLLNRAVGDCGSGFDPDVTKAELSFTARGPEAVTFPAGLVIPDGTVLHVQDVNETGTVYGVTVNGYVLPSSVYCPTIAGCTAGD